MASKQMIKLIANDGTPFVAFEEVIFPNKNIKYMHNNLDYTGDFELDVPVADGKTLKKVLDFCIAFGNDIIKANKKDKRIELTQGHERFLKVSDEVLLKIIATAEFLKIHGLIAISTQKLVNLVAGKNAEEMRKAFKLLDYKTARCVRNCLSRIGIALVFDDVTAVNIFDDHSSADEGFHSGRETSGGSSPAPSDDSDFFGSTGGHGHLDQLTLDDVERTQTEGVEEETKESVSDFGFKMPELLEKPIIRPFTKPGNPISPDFVKQLLSRYESPSEVGAISSPPKDDTQIQSSPPNAPPPQSPNILSLPETWSPPELPNTLFLPQNDFASSSSKIWSPSQNCFPQNEDLWETAMKQPFGLHPSLFNARENCFNSIDSNYPLLEGPPPGLTFYEKNEEFP